MKNGFTLIEMMIVLSVLAIGLAIGMPQMRHFVEEAQIRSVSSDLTQSLWQARSQAMATGRSVTVCPLTADGSTCAANNANWSNGWLVYQGRASQAPQAATILTRSVGVSGAAVASGTVLTMTFDPRGGVSPAEAKITVLCSGSPIEKRSLTVHRNGLIKIGKDENYGCP